MKGWLFYNTGSDVTIFSAHYATLVQVLMLEDEVEKTRTAAKGDIRRLSVELQGLRDEQSQLAQQASRMNVRCFTHKRVQGFRIYRVI